MGDGGIMNKRGFYRLELGVYSWGCIVEVPIKVLEVDFKF